ncbi:MAG TPA: FHA domain-containing protein [Gemmatimonadales bacterium]|nr:FHA domain-containing protein [Gemmatimonadales bacterium]
MPIESPVGPLYTVEEIRAELRASAFSGLQRRYAHPAMVVVGPAEDWGPTTWTRPPDGSDLPLLMLPPLLVTLAPRGLTGTRISFGRAPPCDVLLPFRQLSRVHVHFVRLGGGEWAVEDVGSRNGTVLDGQPVPVGTPLPLRDGAKLRFGDVIAHLMMPRTLHDYLRREPRMETPRVVR